MFDSCKKFNKLQHDTAPGQWNILFACNYGAHFSPPFSFRVVGLCQISFPSWLFRCTRAWVPFIWSPHHLPRLLYPSASNSVKSLCFCWCLLDLSAGPPARPAYAYHCLFLLSASFVMSALVLSCGLPVWFQGGSSYFNLGDLIHAGIGFSVFHTFCPLPLRKVTFRFFTVVCISSFYHQDSFSRYFPPRIWCHQYFNLLFQAPAPGL